VTVEDDVAIARLLFEIAERRDVEAYLEHVHPEVEWRPLSGERDVYRGHEGIREFFRERAAEGESATPSAQRFSAEGELVVVVGSVRRTSRGGLADSSVAWLLRLSEGKLIEMRAFPNEREAREAARARG
jgi:ketosteroid isomerase-like protein